MHAAQQPCFPILFSSLVVSPIWLTDGLLGMITLSSVTDGAHALAQELIMEPGRCHPDYVESAENCPSRTTVILIHLSPYGGECIEYAAVWMRYCLTGSST